MGKEKLIIGNFVVGSGRGVYMINRKRKQKKKKNEGKGGVNVKKGKMGIKYDLIRGRGGG